jgi:hypothetical protein
MLETKPELETRIEDSIARVFRDAFPKVPVHSYGNPGERSGKCVGLRAELGAENPIGTNLYDCLVEIEARNFDAPDRQLLHDMIGNASAAKETLSTHSAKLFAMPRGQAVEMIGAPRTVEDQNERIITYSLSVTIQPI